MCKFLDNLVQVLVNLNKSLANELNQPTTFPSARSNKQIRKTNKAHSIINPPKNQWVWLFFKNVGFSETWLWQDFLQAMPFLSPNRVEALKCRPVQKALFEISATSIHYVL